MQSSSPPPASLLNTGFQSKNITGDFTSKSSVEQWALIRFPSTNNIKLFSISSADTFILYPPYCWPPPEHSIPAIKALIGVIPNSPGVSLVEQVLKDVLCVDKNKDSYCVKSWIDKMWVLSVHGRAAAFNVIDRVFELVCFTLSFELMIEGFCSTVGGKHFS